MRILGAQCAAARFPVRGEPLAVSIGLSKAGVTETSLCVRTLADTVVYEGTPTHTAARSAAEAAKRDKHSAISPHEWNHG